MIHHILNTKVSTSDDAILLNFLVSDMQILKKIEEAWSEQTIREDHSNPCKKRVRRAGYLGHVYRIAHDLQEVITGKENKKYFQEWLETHHDPQFWQTFFDETLKVCTHFPIGLFSIICNPLDVPQHLRKSDLSRRIKVVPHLLLYKRYFINRYWSKLSVNKFQEDQEGCT